MILYDISEVGLTSTTAKDNKNRAVCINGGIIL